MNPRVTKVIPISDFKLDLVFENGEKREFDTTPYLKKGIFAQLKNESYFKKVRVSLGTVVWPNGQDFCPDTLYEDSKILV